MNTVHTLLLACLCTLSGCAGVPSGDRAEEPVATGGLQRVACPASVPALADARCHAGRDAEGSWVVVVVPAHWNGVLVLHAHGGPFLGAPTLARVDEDLARWSIVPTAGYAWAATSYHQGGVAVRAAGDDLVRLRTLALAITGKPRAIVLHGQSWGGNVAAKLAETPEAPRLFDGVLLTSGVLAGGPRAYDHRLDLRVVYQYLCRNHPRPDEPAYPLWSGLPEASRMTREDLEARADACLGVGHAAPDRSADQARRLATLANVVRIPPSSVVNELVFSTFTFCDIARRYGGRSVFGNVGARYKGSDDDVALNAGVARYAADAAAEKAYAEDTDLAGGIVLPTLTMHAIEDPVAFVEMERRFGDRMAAAGHAGNLVQTFTDDRVHSYVSDASYVALLDAMTRWIAGGTRPTPDAIATGCDEAAKAYPSTCRFRPSYRPAPLESRVADRVRP